MVIINIKFCLECKHWYYNISRDLPSAVYPNSLHTTAASKGSQPSRQIVPHRDPLQKLTRPTFGSVELLSRTAPNSVQLFSWAEARSVDIQKV